MYKPQRHLTTLATLATLCGTATPGFAADGIRPLLGMSITGGGERLASVSCDNGDTQAVRSGGLLHLFGGLETLAAHPMSYGLEATWPGEISYER